MVQFPSLAHAQRFASHAWEQLKAEYQKVSNIASDAGTALRGDVRGMLPRDIDVNSPEFKEASSRMAAGLPPVPSIQESEETREYNERVAGYGRTKQAY